MLPQQGGGLQHPLHARLRLAVVQHHRASIAGRRSVTRQHPFEMQLGRGHPRQLQHPLNHQTIAGAAVVEDVHQRHLRLLAGMAVVDHHLHPERPQRHLRGPGHQLRSPLRTTQQQRRQLQAVKQKTQSCPAQPGHHPRRNHQGIAWTRRPQRRQLRQRFQLPRLRSDREGDAEGEVPIKVAVHLSGHHQVVVKTPEQGPLAGLRIAPEVIQRLLIRQTLEVVEGVAHRLGGHGMKQSLEPHGAVHRDHAAAGAQVPAQGTVVEVMHPAADAVAACQQGDQGGIAVVSAVPRMVLEGQMVRRMGMRREGADHVFDEVVHAPVGRSHLDLRVAGDLQHRQEERQMLQQSALQRPLLPAVKPISPAAAQLAPEEPR